MSVEIAIVEEEAELYAERLRAEFPDIVVHAGHTAADVIARCGSCNVIMGLAQCIPPALVQATPRLEWIQALTTGVDPLIMMDVLDPKVPITSARGIHGPQMSEMAFLFMLDFARDIRAILRDQQNRYWERRPQRLLLDKTVAIVGVGVISEELARRCKAFGMRVLGVSSRASADGFDAMYTRDRLEEAAAQADFLIAIVPYTRDTHHMISAAVLDAMPRHGVFINIARGPVVDEEALIERLRDRRIAGAGLDTFIEEPLPASSPLWGLDNVIITPHVGGMSDIYAEQILPLLIHNVRAFKEGRVSDFRNLVRG
ncbi:MAG: D-2-hydroxyacid dehydrogenase [Beijerinckiaceae bacterium]|nr:D-2-hydroxyacid dehydrogenase [Beijerinckiaceae bacterium]